MTKELIEQFSKLKRYIFLNKGLSVPYPVESEEGEWIDRCQLMETLKAYQCSMNGQEAVKVTRGSNGRLLLTKPDGTYFDVTEAIGKTFHTYLSDAQSTIDELKIQVKAYQAQAHGNSDWISVEDRLPEEFVKVIATREGRVGTGRYFMHKCGIAGWDFNGSSMAGDKFKFTHWMPLPPAPTHKER